MTDPHLSVVKHPLIQHKLTIMRQKDVSTATFRQLLREISLLLAYEVTRELELTDITIQTPICEMQAPTLASEPLWPSMALVQSSARLMQMTAMHGSMPRKAVPARGIFKATTRRSHSWAAVLVPVYSARQDNTADSWTNHSLFQLKEQLG